MCVWTLGPGGRRCEFLSVKVPAGSPVADEMDEPLPPGYVAELTRCFKAHAKLLFSYACFVTRGDKELADDLVQEAFQAAARDWRFLRSLEERRIYAWLRMAVHNLAVSSFRRSALEKRKLADVEARYRPVEADTFNDALAVAALERCWQVIESMPARQHLIAVLCWREGMKPPEIAETLEIAVSTVYVQLHDARKKLLAEIGPYHPFALDDTGERSLHDERGGVTS